MIIINKKKILLFSSILLIFIFTFVFQTANINNRTVSVVTLPVSNKVIVLDAGHRHSR